MAKRAQAHDDAARERVEQAHNAILMSQLSRRVADGAEEDVAFADRTPAVSWAPKYAPLEERDLMIGAAVLVGCNYLIKTSPNPGTYFLVAVAWYFYNLRKKIAGFIRSASDSKEDEREADGERTKRAIVVMAMFAGAGYALYTYGLPLLPKSVLVNLRPRRTPSGRTPTTCWGSQRRRRPKPSPGPTRPSAPRPMTTRLGSAWSRLITPS